MCLHTHISYMYACPPDKRINIRQQLENIILYHVRAAVVVAAQ